MFNPYNKHCALSPASTGIRFLPALRRWVGQRPACLPPIRRTYGREPERFKSCQEYSSRYYLGLGNPPQPEPEYVAMQQQENEYLDGLLNLEYCTEIDINKKRKKDNKKVGVNTAVLGLTNVSPQTLNTAGTGAWTTPMDMDIDNVEPSATHVTSTLTTTHPDVAWLEQEATQQKLMINHMEQQ